MNLTCRLSLSLLAFAPVLASAQPLSYAQTTVEVSAGVLVMPGMQRNGVSDNAAPHAWGNLDQDGSSRPAKWTFVNPASQTVLTTNVMNRWRQLDLVSKPALGSRLTKNTAPYWEVPLDTTSDEAISRYDVLLLPIAEGLTVNAPERDKLRRYVDQGGVLWVDLVNDTNTVPGVDLVNPLPFPFAVATSGAPEDANLFHPLFQFPNPLTLNELALSEYAPKGPLVTTPLPNIPGDLVQIERWLVPDSLFLLPVAGNTGGSTVSVGKIGQGYVVLTSRGVSATLNHSVDLTNGWLRNNGYYGLDVPNDLSFAAAAKLAVNIVSLGGLHTGQNGGSRQTGSNQVDLTAPLLNRFSDDQGGGMGAFLPGQQPLLYKGRVVVARGNKLFCYDARPDRDLDGDGDPDDGLRNPIGSLADLVWVSQPMGTRISSPTLAEAPATVLTDPNRKGFRPTDQVWVTSDDGNVYVYDLDADGVTNQGVLGNWPALATIAPESAPLDNPLGPFPPVVQESLVLVTDSAEGLNGLRLGRVWVIDLNNAKPVVTQGKQWQIAGATRYPEPSSAPTAGYIPIQDGSGGLDRVIYVATQPSSSGPTQRPAGVTSVWLGARAESPIRREYDPNTNQLTFTTRASYNGLPIYWEYPSSGPTWENLGLKVSGFDSNGNPLSAAQMELIFGNASMSEPQRGTIMFTGVNPSGWDLDGRQGNGKAVSFRLDYTVDWGKANTPPFGPSPENYVRGNLELPDGQLSRLVVGAPALSTKGTLFVATSFPDGAGEYGGTLFAIKENKGPGYFTLLNRFELYDRLSFTLNNTTGAGETVTVPPVLTDQDTIVKMPFLSSFLNKDIAQWRFASGPSVKGDTVYIMASGIKQSFGRIPTSVLMAFRADVGIPTFQIQGQDANFTIVQPDPALSTNKANPEQYSVLQAGNFTVEPIAGTTRSVVKLSNMMNVTRGRVRDSINTSLPLIIRRPGQTDTMVEPEALNDNGRVIAGLSGGHWNPLAWYMTFQGEGPGAGPVVAGQTLYFGGSSVLPSLISNGNFQPRGLMWAMDANISPNDEFLIANTDRPWTSQLNGFLVQDPNNPRWDQIRGATAVRWPQFKGIQAPDDLRIRILQAAIADPTVKSLAAGDQSLAVTGDNNLYAFSKSDFYVVDAGRVGRFDPAGNPIWATDQTTIDGRFAPTTASNSTRQLSEPNRLYSSGTSGYWIVDTGNNRVVQLDGAAREVRSIDALKLDPIFKPALADQSGVSGLSAAEALKIKRPKDVLVWDTLVDKTIPGANPFSNAQPLERWTHTLIADSGNSRIVELVDRYKIDPVSGRVLGVVQYQDPPGSGKLVSALGVLYWHSPEEFTGKDYSYNSIGRTVQVDNSGVRHNVVGFGFGNVEPGRASIGLDQGSQNQDQTSGYGGVILYDGPRSTVIREFTRPAISKNTFIAQDPNNPGNYGYYYPSEDQPPRRQKLVGLTSVSLRYVDTTKGRVLGVMVTDSTGVYELIEDQANPGNWVVRWMLPIEAYVGMRHPRLSPPWNLGSVLGTNPRVFRPMYAKRLDSGEVLIVNGYTGTLLNGNEFNGEVVLVDGSFASANALAEDPGYALARPNLGFNRLSVKFELPPVQGVRGVIAPVFAQRQ